MADKIILSLIYLFFLWLSYMCSYMTAFHKPDYVQTDIPAFLDFIMRPHEYSPLSKDHHCSIGGLLYYLLGFLPCAVSSVCFIVLRFLDNPVYMKVGKYIIIYYGLSWFIVGMIEGAADIFNRKK